MESPAFFCLRFLRGNYWTICPSDKG
jgi:hypothetical protein